MGHTTHRIRRQRWLVHAPDQETAFALRANLRRTLDAVVLPTFARAFDALNVGDEVLHIPRLELRIRVKDMDELAASLADRLPNLIADQLEVLLTHAPADAAPRRLCAVAHREALLRRYLQSGQLDVHGFADAPHEQISRVRESALLLAQAWQADAATPWHDAPKRLNLAVPYFFRLVQLLPASQTEALVAAILATPSSRASGRRRIILQTLHDLRGTFVPTTHVLLHWQALVLAVASLDATPEETELVSYLKTVAGIDAHLARSVEIALSRFAPDPEQSRRYSIAPRAALLRRYLETGLPDAAGGVGAQHEQMAELCETALAATRDWQANPAALVRDAPSQLIPASLFFLRLLQLLPAQRADELVQSMLAFGSSRSAVLQVLQRLRNLFGATPVAQLQWQALVMSFASVDVMPSKTALLACVQTMPDMSARVLDTLAAELPQDKPQVAQPAKEAPSTHPARRQRPDDMPSPTGCRVHTAGLVLTHPFLSSLFAERGLLGGDGHSLAPDQLSRAAALLHWLACGREEIFEFELALIKPLLGLEPDDWLPVSAGLLDAGDLDECRSLLAALVSHWGALGDTSIEGLQMSFLQRAGLLRRHDQGWQLQVESEPFDLLLGKLPWSFSIVKLPWMTKPIFTEWLLP